MLSEPRAIFFQTKLRWPPLEDFKVDKAVIRRLYNQMFDAGGYQYENLALQGPPTLSSKREVGHSMCRFERDALVLEEDHIYYEIDHFVEVVETLLRALDPKDIPLFFLQECTIRCLSQPANTGNALKLLADRVAKVYHTIAPFERPPSFFGVRFQFQPARIVSGDQAEDAPAGEEHELANATQRPIEVSGFVITRFETYVQDVRQVWMEAQASYPQQKPLSVSDVDKITGHIRQTYEFLTDKSKRFLDQYDTPDPAGQAEE